MSINWGAVYGNNNPIGQLLGVMSPQQYIQLTTAGAQQQVSDLQAQLTQYQNEQSAWTTLQADAKAVASDLNTLSQSSTFQQLTATSSNTNVATATDNSAQAGSYNITISQVAAAEIDQGTTANLQVTDPTKALNISGSFTIQVGSGTTQTVNVSTTDSLNTIVSNINNANAGVTATSEQLSNGDWVLAIQSNTTGASNTITYTDTAGSGQSSGPLNQLGIYNDSTKTNNVVQKAADAELYFGNNSSSTISSSTNTFNNAIPGVTLQAKSTGSATITIGPNVSAMTSSVQQFVNDWNTWVKDTEKLAMPTIAGNPSSSTNSSGQTVSSYQSNPNQEIQSPVPLETLNQIQTLLGSWVGSSSSTNTYQSLADLGITYDSNNTGTLTLNTSTLQSALAQHPNQVGQVFQDIYNKASSLFSGFDTGSTSTTQSAINNDQNQITLLNTQISQAKNNLTMAQNNAISEYGQWVKALSSLASENALIMGMQGNNNGSNGSGG